MEPRKWNKPHKWNTFAVDRVVFRLRGFTVFASFVLEFISN